MRGAGAAGWWAWLMPTMAVCALAACSSGPDEPGGTSPPGTTSAAGSPSPTSVSCPKGSKPDRAGPADQPRPALVGPDVLAAMSRPTAQVVVGETGLTSSGAGTWSLEATWLFDVCTNTWRRGGTGSTSAQRPELAQFVDYEDAGVVVGLPFGLVPAWTYDLTTDRWTQLPANDSTLESRPSAVYDPDGKQLLDWQADTGTVRSYNLSANVWSVLDTSDAGVGPQPQQRPEDEAVVVYDSAAKRLLLILTTPGSKEQGRTWAFDPSTRRWAERARVPNTLENGFPAGWAAAFDPGTERTYVFGDTALLSYDAGEDRWTVHERGPGWPSANGRGKPSLDPLARAGHALVADPVNGRLIVLGGSVRRSGEPTGGAEPDGPSVATDDVWAYDPVFTTWTKLLGRSEQPASIGPG